MASGDGNPIFVETRSLFIFVVVTYEVVFFAANHFIMRDSRPYIVLEKILVFAQFDLFQTITNFCLKSTFIKELHEQVSTKMGLPSPDAL